MQERIARLRTHQKNIDRYGGLLKTNLSENERRFLEKLISEERLAIAMLKYVSPGAHQKSMNLPIAPEEYLGDSG